MHQQRKSYTYTYTHTHTHIYIYTYIHTNKHACIHTYIHTCIQELATEVERAHPNASAEEIAARAMKLLKLVMSKSQSALPSLDASSHSPGSI